MLLNNKEIEGLFRAHFEALHRYAFTILKDEDKAKDAVQAVFLNLLEKEKSIQLQSARSYLFRSVYNQSVNMIRKDNALEKRHLEYMHLNSDAAQEVRADRSNLEIRRRIDSVLNQLPPQCRLVFVKSRMEKKKYTEIAEDLGIAVKTVEAHMSKALKLIRAALRVLVVICCLLIEL